MRLNAIAEAVALHGRARIDDEPAETRFTHQAPAQPAPAPAAQPDAPVAQPTVSTEPMAGFPPADPRILAQAAPPLAPPAAPTAIPQQLAAIDLALSDPLNQELIQAYAPNPVNAASDIARDQVALYGAERFGKMQQLAQATASVRNQYIAALDGAQQNPPTDPNAACPPGWHWETDQPGRDAEVRHTAVFDVDAFTSWYAKQDSLASRAFASLYGRSMTAVEAHGGEQIVSSTNVGGDMFHVSHGYWSQIGEHGEKSGWVGSSIGYTGAVSVIDAQGHPDLIDSKAVWFDPAMGFVTLTTNIKEKQNFLDKALPTLAAIGFTAASGVFGGVSAFAGGGLTGAMAGAAAAGALTTFNSSMLATGSVNLKDVLRSALTGAVTAGITNGLGLNQLGMQGNTVISYADRALAITGQATLQGALQQLSGGKFKDGFTAGIAAGLAAEVTRSMQASIDVKVTSGQMNGAEASAYRLLTQATGSAIRMLANPNDPGHAMAQDFLGSLVQDGAAAVSQSAPMTLDQLHQSEHEQGNAQAAPAPIPAPAPAPDAGESAVDAPASAPTLAAPTPSTPAVPSAPVPDASFPAPSASDAPASPSPSISSDFRTSEREDRASHDASISGAAYRARPGDNVSTVLGTNDPQAIGNFMRANGMTDSAIFAGQNYFIPDDRRAYGDAAKEGQAALDGDNQRLAELAKLRKDGQQERWDRLQEGAWSGRTGQGGPVWHVSGDAGTAMESRAVTTGPLSDEQLSLSLGLVPSDGPPPLPFRLGLGGRVEANPDAPGYVVPPYNPMTHDAPDYTMRFVNKVLGAPVTGAVELGALAADWTGAAYTVTRNELGFGLDVLPPLSQSRRALESGMPLDEYYARANPVGNVMLTSVDLQNALDRGDGAAISDAAANLTIGTFATAGLVRGTAGMAARGLQSAGVADWNVRFGMEYVPVSRPATVDYLTGGAWASAGVVEGSSLVPRPTLSFERVAQSGGLDGVGNSEVQLSATQLRNTPGVVTVSGELTPASGRWLDASVPTPIPAQVGDALTGQSFNTFGDLRQAIWQQIGSNPELNSGFSRANLAKMNNGLAPSAPSAWLNETGAFGDSFNIHHAEPIELGGPVYDLGNLQIVSPKVHFDIHYGSN